MNSPPAQRYVRQAGMYFAQQVAPTALKPRKGVKAPPFTRLHVYTFPPLPHRNIIHHAIFPPQVIFRRKPRELLEVPDEVGLVEVAAIEGEVAPLDIAPLLDLFDGPLKTDDAHKSLGRQADLLFEQLNKVFLRGVG